MPESDLVERVDRDPALSAAEKETTITMYGDEKQYQIFSAKPTIVKSLLKHDHFDMDWARLLGEDTWEHVDERAEIKENEGDIVAVEGTMPIGTLTVKSKPRSNNHQSSIISTETIDASVFQDE